MSRDGWAPSAVRRSPFMEDGVLIAPAGASLRGSVGLLLPGRRKNGGLAGSSEGVEPGAVRATHDRWGSQSGIRKLLRHTRDRLTWFVEGSGGRSDHPPVAHRLALARVRPNLRPVHRHPSEPHQTHPPRQANHLGGSLQGHARAGASGAQFGWLVEAYSLGTDGFKELPNPID